MGCGASNAVSPAESSTDAVALVGRATKAEMELDELRNACIRICATEWRTSDWKVQRETIARLCGSGNTYSTWSLSLASMLETPLLIADANQPKLTPASLGVKADSSPKFLKALDLGNGDQRTITAHLE